MKRFLGSTLLALTLIFGSAISATAHSDEVKTNPVDGATIDGGFQSIEIEFAEPLLELSDGQGSEIVIKLPNGEVMQELSCVSHTTNAISIDGFFIEPGSYQAIWRSVSEDGHPVSGSFEFKVDTSVQTPGEVIPCESPSVIAPSPVDAESDPDYIPILIAVAVAALLITGLLIVIGVAERNKRKS